MGRGWSPSGCGLPDEGSPGRTVQTSECRPGVYPGYGHVCGNMQEQLYYLSVLKKSDPLPVTAHKVICHLCH